jgi:GNAT superfamily N-acetyltransferase
MIDKKPHFMEVGMDYRELNASEIDRSLFKDFQRHQVVTKCWRKTGGKWHIEDIPFIDDWSEEDYVELIVNLKNIIITNGVVFGAFSNKLLKGFASVESSLLGTSKEYLDLSNIHVSEDMRGKGIGTELFRLAKTWAKEHGAKKLYISAHSAVESQAFYHAMGCIEAREYNRILVEKEPCDCQLEYKL